MPSGHANIGPYLPRIRSRPHQGAWHEQRACRDVDPAVFFPSAERGDDADKAAEPAKAICRVCPVQTECLTAALEGREEGIWGGTTEREREAIRRRRRIRARGAA